MEKVANKMEKYSSQSIDFELDHRIENFSFRNSIFSSSHYLTLSGNQCHKFKSIKRKFPWPSRKNCEILLEYSHICGHLCAVNTAKVIYRDGSEKKAQKTSFKWNRKKNKSDELFDDPCTARYAHSVSRISVGVRRARKKQTTITIIAQSTHN